MRKALGSMVVSLFLLPAFAHAADKSAMRAAESGCGPLDARFKAVPLPEHTGMAPPTAGQATVYIVSFSFGVHPAYKLEAGLDGTWDALIRSSGHIQIALTPGPHHVCVRIANNLVGYKDRRIAVANIDVEAGHTYYLAASAGLNFVGLDVGWPIIALRPINSDEGAFLVATTRAFGLRRTP